MKQLIKVGFFLCFIVSSQRTPSWEESGRNRDAERCEPSEQSGRARRRRQFVATPIERRRRRRRRRTARR